MRIRRRSQGRGAAVVFALLAFSCDHRSIGKTEQIVLVPGQVLSRQLAGERPHGFEFASPADRFLHLIVEQRGVDVRVRLENPSGAILYEIDRPSGEKGPEPVLAVTPAAGRYRLVAAPLGRDARGEIALKILAVRPATPRDRRCAASAAGIARAEQRWLARDFERAATGYLQSLPGFVACGDPERRAESEWHLGESLLATGELRKAAVTLEGAAASFQRLGERLGEARAATHLGGAWRQLGDPRRALAAYERALRLYREAGVAEGEAGAINNIGLVYERTGELQPAIEQYEQALAIWRRLGIESSEAATLENLGRLYSLIGHDDEALDLLRQALRLAGEGDDRSRISPLTALAWALHLAGRNEEALERFEEALALAERHGERLLQMSILDRRASALKALRRNDEAAASYSRALALSRQVGSKISEGNTLANLGWLDLETGAEARGAQRLRQARDLLAASGDPNGQVYALVGLSRAGRQLGDLKSAREHAEGAVRLVEEIRQGLHGPLSRGHFLSTRFNAFEELVTLLMDLGHAREALEMAERARARNLVEEIERRPSPPRPSCIEKEACNESAASPQCRDASVRRLRGGENASLGKIRPRAVMVPCSGEAASETPHRGVSTLRRSDRASSDRFIPSRKAELLAEIEALEERRRTIADGDPRDARLAGIDAALRSRWLEVNRLSAAPGPPPEFASVAEMQSLADAETVLVVYLLAEPASFAWTVDRGSVVAHRLPGRERIEKLARRVVAALPRSHELSTRETTARGIRELSHAILGPLGARLAGRRRLVVLADGALNLVPFGALPSAEQRGEPLLVNHEIAMLPSATVLLSQRERLAGRAPAPGAIAVLADPVFSLADERLARTRGDADRANDREDLELQPLPRLPYTAEEARAIHRLVARQDALLAVGTAARRDLVLSGALRRYRILHFATHGLLHPVLPERSGVVLSRFDQNGKRIAGFLSAPDVAGLDLPAELAVLSACHTALGRELRGEGLVGLTQAFFRAGVRGVVVGYWKVDDRATSALMAGFYRNLLIEGQPPAAALRKAQLAVRNEEKWRSPYYWAGFALHGDWR